MVVDFLDWFYFGFVGNFDIVGYSGVFLSCFKIFVVFFGLVVVVLNVMRECGVVDVLKLIGCVLEMMDICVMIKLGGSGNRICFF